MKKYLIAGNWKMNTNVFEAEKLSEYILGGIKQMPELKKNVNVLVCPPFTNLPAVHKIIKNSRIALGAQNCHNEDSGAYTGEISVQMLSQIGCEYCIIGHSERRQYFKESDSFINSKCKTLLSNNLTPVLCIGESLEQRQNGETFDVLGTQLKDGLAGISNEDMGKIVIAYEPVWAIGTGLAATPAQAEEAHVWIREFLHSNLYAPSEEMLILYGGSMNAKNAKEILSLENVNGGLIGGASLDPEAFLTIIKTAESLG